jgi:hypothetical protein
MLNLWIPLSHCLLEIRDFIGLYWRETFISRPLNKKMHPYFKILLI